MRELLDSLGATHTKIVVTSDLDEFAIAALSGAPVDGYGVGTALVTGSGHPTCEFVYKLVARAESDAIGAPMVAVAKKSVNKISVGGRKYACDGCLRRVRAPKPRSSASACRRRLTATTARCWSSWWTAARLLEMNRLRPCASVTCAPRRASA